MALTRIKTAGIKDANVTSQKYDISGTGNGAIQIPIGTTAQRPTNPSEGATRYNSEILALETYLSASWNTIINFTGLTPSTPASSPQQIQNIGLLNGYYWYKSQSMTSAIQLYTYTNMTDGKPWVRVFSSPFASNATLNYVGYNIPWKGFLIQRDVQDYRYYSYFSSYQTFNTRSDTTTTTGGNISGYRVFIGNAGGHGFYNTSQAPCSWSNAGGSVGAGYDGTCGSWPNGLRWGVGQSGTAQYTMVSGTWETWLWWD